MYLDRDQKINSGTSECSREKKTPEARFPRTLLVGNPVNRGNGAASLIQGFHQISNEKSACYRVVVGAACAKTKATTGCDAHVYVAICSVLR